LLNVIAKTEGQQRLRAFLIIFRWLAFFLGLAVTSFGSLKELTNPLPTFFVKMPIILFLLLGIYQLIASLVCLKFDGSKFNTALLVLMDLCVGALMSWFYGLAYFLMMVVLPVLEAAFYFGTFISMLVLVLIGCFFIPLVFMHLFKLYSSVDKLKDVLLGGLWKQISILGFSSIAIYLNFLWALKQEEEFQGKYKKFQDEKGLLSESIQSTKREFGDAFTQLEKKDELIAELEVSLTEAEEQLLEANQTMENMMNDLDDMRESTSEVEHTALEHQQKIIMEQKAFRDQMQDELEHQKMQLKEKYETELELLRETIDQMHSNVGANEAEYMNKIEDLEKKILILVGKMSDLSTELKTRENIFDSYNRINESVELEGTYLAILEEALKLVPSQTAILFIKETGEKVNSFFAEVAATPYQNLFLDYSVQMGEGSVGWVARNLKALKIDSGKVKLKDRSELATLLRYERSAIVLPILFEKEAIGVLYMGRPDEKAYSNSELYLMKAFCKLAGSAISSAIQLNKAMTVSLIDETTGLYNDVYFYERFNEEFGRSLRYEIPMTLVMMEILNYDAFAESSEKFVLNRVVQDLAEILRSNIRETDLAARPAPAQFAVIFMHTEKPDIILVAERIRMAAEMRSFGSPQAKSAGLHLSVGLANLPEDSENRDELYELAMKNLDEARRRGGSQICFPP